MLLRRRANRVKISLVTIDEPDGSKQRYLDVESPSTIGQIPLDEHDAEEMAVNSFDVTRWDSARSWDVHAVLPGRRITLDSFVFKRRAQRFAKMLADRAWGCGG